MPSPNPAPAGPSKAPPPRGRLRAWAALATLALLAGAAACRGPRPRLATSPWPPLGEGEVAILSINDVYRIEGVDGRRQGGLDRLRTLRRELEARYPELLVLHAGDFLFPSLLSRHYEGAQMIDVLNALDGAPGRLDERMFVTLGNHELDLRDPAELSRRIAESELTWLDTNVAWAEDDDGRPRVEAPNLRREALLELGGVRVGLFSLTTDLAKPDYVAAIADPVATARTAVAALRRQGADLVVALTHLTLEADLRVLAELGGEGPDLVIGGHDHERVEREVGGRWVLKADSDARSAVLARARPRPGEPPEVAFERLLVGPDVPPDRDLEARIDGWLRRHDEETCAQKGLPPDCLDEVFGRTRVELVGEELAIRRCETNLGNWIADQALAALVPAGAQIAFLNSGGLRLNQDLPAGSQLTLRHVGETFAYPSPLRLVRIDGATLGAVARQALVEWPGNGRFLQVAGFAFRADPGTGEVADLTLVGPDGLRPIDPGEELLAVTHDFLLGGGDGYAMLSALERVPYPGEPFELADLVVRGLQAAEPAGIAPQVEGRICLDACGGKAGCLAIAGGVRQSG